MALTKTAHGTLTAGSVTTVTIVPGEEGIVVVNRDLDGELWVRLDNQDPAVGQAGSYVVIGARVFPMARPDVRKGITNVRLIADADRAYSVEAVQ